MEMANLLLVLIFFLIVFNILLVNLSSGICGTVNAEEFNFTDFNASNEELYNYAKISECSGIPSIIALTVNTPVIFVVGLILKKMLLV